MVEFAFETMIIEWRGPAPFHFAPIPDEYVEAVRRAARIASYGWGVVPVEATIGSVVFTTSLFPKDGGYLLPIKVAARTKAKVTVGDTIAVTMTIQAPAPGTRFER
ncbi:MAG: DUF1905 domain-containing protein [Devosia sp.]